MIGDMTVLKNKEPVWNDRLGAYALNFNGRARIPSVKNFQLIHPEQPDYIMMQYGKMDKDIFTLDIQFPLSPLQAFGMALAGVDNKLVCD
jgi:tubby-related protein 1